MIWHSYLSTFFHINKKNIKKHLLEVVISETRRGRFKSFRFSLKLSSLLHHLVSLRQMQLLALNHSFSTNPLTSKVNLVYNPYSWAPRRFMPRWFGIIPNNRANKIHANRCSEKSIRIHKEIKVKQGILRMIVTEITSNRKDELFSINFTGELKAERTN